MAAWTYMLLCADGSYYVGCTTDLDQRFGQHLAGEMPGYTATRRPVRMVWADEFDTVHDAIAMERRMKGWSRAKKQALVAGDWDRLRALASRAGTPKSLPACFETPFGLLSMTSG